MSLFSYRKLWRRYRGHLFSVSSSSRAQALLDVHLDLTIENAPLEIEHALFLRIVGNAWSCIDGDRTDLVGVLSNIWVEMEDPRNFIRWIQPAPARRAHAALPSKVRAFRGCYEGVNDDGVCFSLDRKEAKKFAGHYARYLVSDARPLLISITLPKECSFLVVDRGEDEIVNLFPEVFGKRRHARRLVQPSWEKLLKKSPEKTKKDIGITNAQCPSQGAEGTAGLLELA